MFRLSHIFIYFFVLFSQYLILAHMHKNKRYIVENAQVLKILIFLTYSLHSYYKQITFRIINVLTYNIDHIYINGYLLNLIKIKYKVLLL
jgi:hypothetical protein